MSYSHLKKQPLVLYITYKIHNNYDTTGMQNSSAGVSRSPSCTFYLNSVKLMNQLICCSVVCIYFSFTNIKNLLMFSLCLFHLSFNSSNKYHYIWSELTLTMAWTFNASTEQSDGRNTISEFLHPGSAQSQHAQPENCYKNRRFSANATGVDKVLTDLEINFQ